jgi:hypothetical protein
MDVDLEWEGNIMNLWKVCLGGGVRWRGSGSGGGGFDIGHVELSVSADVGFVNERVGLKEETNL